MAGDIALVGRAAELDRIITGLRSESLAGFVLAGAAGIGKTRLATESARAAEELGYSTAQVHATKAAASIPFGPFAPLVPDAGTSSGGLLGLLRSVGDAIVERAGEGKPLLLVVDDAHLLDDGSAALVHQLAQAGTCKIVATIRTPGAAPDPITALWKDGLADRLDLNPLDEAQAADFAQSILGGPLAGVTVRRLWQVSNGNALYMRELLRGAVASGALTTHDGVWIQRQPLTAPERLVELLAARLDDLPQPAADVVDLVAVAGTLGFDLLERLTSSEAAEEAESLALFEVRQDGRRSEVSFAHPLYGEIRRQRLPRSKLRRLHALLAEALEATGARRRDDLLRLATWHLDAGLRGDPDLLARGVRRARHLFDMDLAKRLAKAALEAGGGVDSGLVLAEAQFASGEPAEAEVVLAGIEDRCATDAERASVANARAYNLAVMMNRPEDAIVVLDDALGVITDDAARLVLLARSANISLFSGRPVTALEAMAGIVTDDPGTASRRLYNTSIALGMVGRTAEAVVVAAEGLAVHRNWTEPTQVPESQLVGATIAHMGAGDLAEAEECAVQGLAAALDVGDQEGVATYALLRGWVSLEQGRLVAAARAFREGAALNRELNDDGARRWCAGGLAVAEGMAGRAAEAKVAVAELDALGHHWMAIFDADLIDRGRCWAMAAAGEVTHARRALGSAAEVARDRGQAVAEARLLHDIARLGGPASVVNRLKELSAAVDGGLVATFAEHATAATQGSALKLEVVAERFADMGTLLLAAEAATEASAAYRSEGRARQANGAAVKASQWTSDLGGARVAALDADPETHRLTDREREVAGLAASGVSSRDIAARLFISPRTVDNHLQRVYDKLGVSSREELAELLGG